MTDISFIFSIFSVRHHHPVQVEIKFPFMLYANEIRIVCDQKLSYKIEIITINDSEEGGFGAIF